MKARIIAFYLPQFHPIPENDRWWGKGFTEWTNVGKARKRFHNHYQPRVPADLGYYDLRVPETRRQQADMAKAYGIEGFCYWHYWFGNGKRLLERPFNEILSSGSPDFPFCLAWANETWKGFDHGLKNRNTLIEQLYPGEQDYTAHFHAVLPAFKDTRYITVEGKPLFMIYKPLAHPDIRTFIDTWRQLAIENGLPGIYFIGHCNDYNIPVEEIRSTGVDAVNTTRINAYAAKRSRLGKIYGKLRRTIRRMPVVFPYKKASRHFLDPGVDAQELVFPSIIPGWDHTPRSGNEGLVLHHSTPGLFEAHVREAVEIVAHKEPEHRIVFLKSWNEWAEGNYMEPDQKWGHQYLQALHRQIQD